MERCTTLTDNKFMSVFDQSSEMMIKCGFICERYSINLFMHDVSTPTHLLVRHRISESLYSNFAFGNYYVCDLSPTELVVWC